MRIQISVYKINFRLIKQYHYCNNGLLSPNQMPSRIQFCRTQRYVQQFLRSFQTVAHNILLPYAANLMPVLHLQ